ncbi:multidrug resistance-associated protein 1 isoform X2 [Octopus bimaculoides]|uniref:multidrug resistance-associated protein 1 isoform X2 n=1 Tax=Octopus bimaculoides TaxID=37653 RepID=UPI00071D8098|nr:multidrug resistance-associated protein 1 isoform X2 [Octopus bimaculoides]|eukprot:XP_014791161.1 PREDICTED: multidrug resistance-associated protein 1-like isoform X2 [Octopus bimaculoides]
MTPCAFLWLMLPFRCLDIYWNKKRKISVSKIFILKLLGLFVLLTCVTIKLLYNLSKATHPDIYPVDIMSSFVLLLTMLLVLIFLHIERKGGITSSGILVAFWLLLLIGHSLMIISHVKSVIGDKAENVFNNIIFYITYAFIVIEFLFSCFLDEGKTPEFVPSNVCPEERASFLSNISFWWVTPILVKGYRKSLEFKDLWTLNSYLTSKEIVVYFNKYWQNESKKHLKIHNEEHLLKKNTDDIKVIGGKKPSLVKCLLRAFGDKVLLAVFFKLIHDVLLFVSPMLLKLLIQFITEKSVFMWQGFLYASLLLISATLQSIVLHQYFHNCLIVGMELRTTITSAVYCKSLTLSNSARKTATVGEIVNLMSIDAQKFQDLMTYVNTIWSGPLQIMIALYFLWLTLGPSIFVGVGILIFFIAMNMFILNAKSVLQMKQMKLKDSRIKVMNEILNGIKVLKLYAWENSFKEQIMKIRNDEMRILRKQAYLNAFTTLTWTCAPVFVSLFTFVVYVLSDEKNILDAEKAFVALSLFHILRFPLMMLPNTISNLIAANVSMKRVTEFLNKDELDLKSVEHSLTDSDSHSVIIENGSFKWDKDEPCILKNIHFKVAQGTLVAVVGVVGSGKSSLISAILGEMEKCSGKVDVQSNVAYVAQQAWIQNDTLQNNILFGKQYHQSFYAKIINACALHTDFKILPAGDQTEIGEKGINLSGGQKQRVSLARAVYQEANVYLLDDPLSAVDSHVGKHLFEKVIGPNGILSDKTRILVTHNINYLEHMDMIIVMKDGQISERGTFQELLGHKGEFSEFLQNYLTEQKQTGNEADEEQETDDDIHSSVEEIVPEVRRRWHGQEDGKMGSPVMSLKSENAFELTEKEDQSTPKDKLINKEATMTGNVKLSVFLAYAKFVGAKFISVTLVTFFMVGAINIYANIWLSEWSNDALLISQNGTIDISQRDLRLSVYGVLGISQNVMSMIAALLTAYSGMHASCGVFDKLLENILHLPLSAFDAIPVGRIINRFSFDMDDVDNVIPFTIRSLLNTIITGAFTFLILSINTPLVISIVPIVGILFIYVKRIYIATSRQLKRLESVSRSPIFSHFGETVSGATSIRAFNKQNDFIRESEKRVDDYNITYYPSLVINRWLAFRTEFMSNLIVFFSAVFSVTNRNSLTPGSVGLAVTYALSVTQTLNWFIRMASELETNIVAVERIKEYSEIPTEGPYEIKNNKPAPEWPEKGEVVFSNYATRYRENMDLVIKDISCRILPMEKVGIVGRTGAGKSSLTLSLFRIIEAAEGSIIIDDVNVSKIGLYDLRSKLTIIPQDPILFSGTLRMNLDPFDYYTDSQLWEALEHSHLNEFVKSQPKGLLHECAEGGENLSLGQRQLLCLARALLRKSKILILDEATAAVDLETDALIQQTIRSEFKDSTVITIAHRLNTIMDYSKIIVMDKGRICEFDSPGVLLQNKDSLFYSLAKAADLVAEQ